MRALERVEFSPDSDRVFCTGDLIDRGPESFDTLLLLEEPWFHSVAGNHEHMLTQLLEGECLEEDVATFAANGGGWFFELSDDDHSYLKEVLREKLVRLPLVLRVNSAHGDFQVAHAELCASSGHTLTDAEVESSDLLQYRVSLQWGRSRIKQILHADKSPSLVGKCLEVHPAIEPGLMLTYVGHSIVPHPILHRSHYYMDGGANRLYRGKFGQLFLAEHGKRSITCINQANLHDELAA